MARFQPNAYTGADTADRPATGRNIRAAADLGGRSPHWFLHVPATARRVPMEILEHHLFRVTRNADLALEEEEAPDLLEAIEEELRKRRFGNVVRLEIERSMPHATRALLMRGLNVEAPDVYEISGMLDLNALNAIADLDVASLYYSPYQPDRKSVV